MMNTIRKLLWTSLVVFLTLPCGAQISWAQQTFEVDVSGEKYNPDSVTVSSGDTIRFCNKGIWRRQPFSGNEYNRFGQRSPETYAMISQGECKTLKVRNPTTALLKFTVHDAVTPEGKLKVSVHPGK